MWLTGFVNVSVFVCMVNCFVYILLFLLVGVIFVSYEFLIVDGCPVAFVDGDSDRNVLKDMVGEFAGFPLRVSGTIYDGERLDSVDALEEFCDYHNGAWSPCVDLVDCDGNDVYFFIVNSFYLYDYWDDIKKDMFDAFCIDNDIVIE